MRLPGRVFKSGRYWAIEVPVLGIYTQGKTKKDAYGMIGDAIESLVNRRKFRLKIYPGRGDYFEIGADDQAAWVSFLLHRIRIRRRLTLAEVSARLGSKSPNTYARYEQGVSVPTVEKFSQLLNAVSPEIAFVLRESSKEYQIKRRKKNR